MSDYGMWQIIPSELYDNDIVWETLGRGVGRKFRNSDLDKKDYLKVNIIFQTLTREDIEEMAREDD